MPLKIKSKNRTRFLRFDQRFVQTTRRGVGEYPRNDVDSRKVRMRAGRNMVKGLHELGVAGASQSHRALTILSRLDRVDLLQRAGRPRNGREVFVNQPEWFLFVKLAGDQQDDVIRLVIVAIERLQPFDRHVFNVAARSDGSLDIVMPDV